MSRSQSRFSAQIHECSSKYGFAAHSWLGAAKRKTSPLRRVGLGGDAGLAGDAADVDALILGVELRQERTEEDQERLLHRSRRRRGPVDQQSRIDAGVQVLRLGRPSIVVSAWTWVCAAASKLADLGSTLATAIQGCFITGSVFGSPGVTAWRRCEVSGWESKSAVTAWASVSASRKAWRLGGGVRRGCGLGAHLVRERPGQSLAGHAQPEADVGLRRSPVTVDDVNRSLQRVDLGHAVGLGVEVLQVVLLEPDQPASRSGRRCPGRAEVTVSCGLGGAPRGASGSCGISGRV